MKQIEVVAAIIRKGDKIFASQRGYGNFKDWWEFPGGKMEVGESPEEALRREIREELSTEISVDEYICTVEYDYPKFHLTARKLPPVLKIPVSSLGCEDLIILTYNRCYDFYLFHISLKPIDFKY